MKDNMIDGWCRSYFISRCIPSIPMFDHFERFWMIQPLCLLLKLVEFVAAFNPTNWNHPWKRRAKLDLSPSYQPTTSTSVETHSSWWFPCLMVNSPHLRVPDSSVSSRILLAPLVSSFSDILSGTEYQELPWLPCDFGGEKNMLVAEKLEDLRFTSDLEKNWAQSLA